MDVEPIVDSPPVLEWIELANLKVDKDYQRSTELDASQAAIRSYARNWSWCLCGTLIVTRRPDETLWIIDGQHRWEAAQLRSDITQLPCLVFNVETQSSEATLFTNLNKKRRPLSGADVFRAKVIAGDSEAVAVAKVIKESGLTIAPHNNYNTWKPGMIHCIPTIQSAYRNYGEAVISNTLVAFSEAYQGKILKHAGLFVKSLVIIYSKDAKVIGFDPDRLIERIGMETQDQWKRKAQIRAGLKGEAPHVAMMNVILEGYHSL